jgi:cytochrome c biogenesis protein CcdA
MTLLIAFIGGMVSLLSPCTLPVIPLLFAGFRGQPRQIAAMLFGMVQIRSSSTRRAMTGIPRP